ncbi:hypothetical protein GN277_22320 [Lachnospiraceae bacterium WCA-9-b2]|uniref:Uncharacterized protein n=1 Tax=Sporofaciens musculi TaxID=2681861 RepID=A0A7X3MKM3_9FIRM|nr:hypothetical protein [Dorea sp.]MXP77987.1 hypothetical protein [Sporofaciens musculi]
MTIEWEAVTKERGCRRRSVRKHIPWVSQSAFLGRSQKMLRTVTSVERYHRYKIVKIARYKY